MTDKKPIAYDAYQELADHYAAAIDTKPHNAFYDRPATLSMHESDLSGKVVFDAGCGPGAYSEVLAKRGAEVHACDISEKMLEHAAQRNKNQNVIFHHRDLTQPFDIFDNAKFDAINAGLCLDYVKDWTSLFKEFARLLKPGGRFVYSCGHPSFDAEYFKTSQYFGVELVSSVWSGFGTETRMPSYRRSLEEAINPVMAAGLILDKVHEPRPTEEFKIADPLRYMRLMHRPGFLCIRARKPA